MADLAVNRRDIFLDRSDVNATAHALEKLETETGRAKVEEGIEERVGGSEQKEGRRNLRGVAQHKRLAI